MQQFVECTVHRFLIRKCALLLRFASGFVRETPKYGIVALFGKRATFFCLGFQRAPLSRGCSFWNTLHFHLAFALQSLNSGGVGTLRNVGGCCAKSAAILQLWRFFFFGTHHNPSKSSTIVRLWHFPFCLERTAIWDCLAHPAPPLVAHTGYVLHTFWHMVPVAHTRVLIHIRNYSYTQIIFQKNSSFMQCLGASSRQYIRHAATLSVC